MRKSGAQRQAEYRQRHLKDETGTLERINLLVSIAAKRQLERLAYCYDVTQRAMLEKLLAEAEWATLAALSPAEQADFLDSAVRYTVTRLPRPAGPELGDRFRLIRRRSPRPSASRSRRGPPGPARAARGRP
jgi:hypothetical protein